MGIIDFLSSFELMRPLSFQQHPDSFAATRVTLYERLMEVVKSLHRQHEQSQDRLQNRSQSPIDSAIFIAAHFPDEFFRLQEELDKQKIEYEIITRPLDSQWFLDHSVGDSHIIYLALAEFLTETTFGENVAFGTALDLIVVDRHPEPFRDALLVQFARDFPAITRMGYFMALDDCVLNSVVNDTTLLVLDQMGIDDRGLISSGIISKRIKKVLAREQKQRTVEGTPADSAEDWFEINVASPDGPYFK